MTSRLLFSFPNDHSSVGVARGEHAFVVVEADVEHGARVALELVDARLRVALHVEEEDGRVLAAGY